MFRCLYFGKGEGGEFAYALCFLDTLCVDEAVILYVQDEPPLRRAVETREKLVSSEFLVVFLFRLSSLFFLVDELIEFFSKRVLVLWPAR